MTEKRDISTIVGECAGAVSACWSNLEAAGTFDSSQAKKHVDDALAEIEALNRPDGTEKVEFQFTGVTRDDVSGDVTVTVIYPVDKGVLALNVLGELQDSKYGANLASALRKDPSVAAALNAAGIYLSTDDEDGDE